METNNNANIKAVNTLIAIQEKLIGTNELNNSAGLLNHNLDLERKVLPNFEISDITQKEYEASKDSNLYLLNEEIKLEKKDNEIKSNTNLTSVETTNENDREANLERREKEIERRERELAKRETEFAKEKNEFTKEKERLLKEIEELKLMLEKERQKGYQAKDKNNFQTKEN